MFPSFSVPILFQVYSTRSLTDCRGRLFKICRYKSSFPTSQRILSSPLQNQPENSVWRLVTENYTECRYTVWQNLEFLNVAASGTKYYDCAERVLEQNYNFLNSILSPDILNVASPFTCLLGLTVGSINIGYVVFLIKHSTLSGNYPTNIPLSSAFFSIFRFTKRTATQVCYEIRNQQDHLQSGVTIIFSLVLQLSLYLWVCNNVPSCTVVYFPSFSSGLFTAFLLNIR